MNSNDEHVTVWLDEEYGYRYWRWEPAMTGAELVEWWKNLKTVGAYFFSPEALPGKLVQIHMNDMPILPENDGLWKAHIHEDEDSFLRQPDGTCVKHAGYKTYN